ncbi:hypothetical protein [Sorangium cellulosum]|uniref:Secreted protein n=1 Tax=Sorangium cellulosum TaxID=56 RepID=A0A150QT43_SORCE|nr:hypothetical protein [Sorangium cellulosum]KYF71120.1 hypothetical protein BE15_09430 [Sorangium cellulosum]
MTRRSPAPLLLALAALAAGSSLAASARADEALEDASSTIAVVCAPGDRFGLRVVAELESLGFRAAILDPAADAPASRASLEASARDAGAIAAIRAVPSGRGVEVWIADRVTGKTVLREMAGDAGAPDSDAALALRVVELLRASLLEAALPAPPPGELPATPEIREKLRVPAPAALADPPSPSPPPSPALRVALAPGALLSPGGLGAAASVDLGVVWMPSEHAGAVAFAAIPLTSARIERANLDVDLSVQLTGGGARFTTRAGRWAPSADLGLAVVSLQSTGMVVSSSFSNGEPSTMTVAPFTRLGLAFAVTPTFRLRADVLASVVVEGVSIQIAGREIATWGRPILLSSAGIDLGWF